jgi:hypothetical protein
LRIRGRARPPDWRARSISGDGARGHDHRVDGAARHPACGCGRARRRAAADRAATRAAAPPP